MTVIDELRVLITGDVKGLDKPLTEAERKIKGFRKETKETNKVFGLMSKSAARLGGGLAVLSAATWGVKLAAQAETARVQFEVLTGSATAATAVIDELNKFAAETPLGKAEIQDAARALLAFGSNASNVTGELRRIGDIAGLTGNSIGELATLYGKARVQGRLFAEDINQMTGRGIPVIQEFAKQLGVSTSEVKKLGSEGKITFANLERAFIDLTSEGGKFAGGMAKQSETLVGQWSTLKDNFAEIAKNMGEAIVPGAKKLAEFSNQILENQKEGSRYTFGNIPGENLEVRVGGDTRAAGGIEFGGLAFGSSRAEVSRRSRLDAALGESRKRQESFIAVEQGKEQLAAGIMNSLPTGAQIGALVAGIGGRVGGINAGLQRSFARNRGPGGFGLPFSSTEAGIAGGIGGLLRGAAGGITGGMDALGGLGPGARGIGEAMRAMEADFDRLSGRTGRTVSGVQKGSVEAVNLAARIKAEESIDREMLDLTKKIETGIGDTAKAVTELGKKLGIF